MKKAVVFVCVFFILSMGKSNVNILDNKISVYDNDMIIDSLNMVEYGFIIGNKYIFFSLPKYYCDTCYPRHIFLVDYWSGYESKYCFYSTKNEHNFFSFLIDEDSLGMKNEEILDTLFMNTAFYNCVLYNMDPPFVPFIEKKRDKNGYLYYFVMGACIDILERERLLEIEEQHSIYSYFEYYTFRGFKSYRFVLINRDKMRDFSYEEKRTIIESVRIEEIE